MTGDANMVTDSERSPTVEKTMIADDSVVADGDIGGVEEVGPHMDGGVPWHV